MVIEGAPLLPKQYQIICRNHQQKIADHLLWLANEWNNDAIRVASIQVRHFTLPEDR